MYQQRLVQLQNDGVAGSGFPGLGGFVVHLDVVSLGVQGHLSILATTYGQGNCRHWQFIAGLEVLELSRAALAEDSRWMIFLASNIEDRQQGGMK